MYLPQLTIDLTVTKACNFGCDYCFEKGQHESKEMSKETFDKIIEYMKRNQFRYNLMIMGGEPSIAKNLKYFFKRLKKEIEEKNIKLTTKKLSVYITNGYNYKNVLDHFEDIDFWKKYFHIQVSYDGKPIQDKYRKTLDGKLTSDIVLNSFKEFNKYFYTTIKSTINLYDFKYLEEVLKEFKSLNEEYPQVFYIVTENKSSFIFNKEKIKEIIDEVFPKVLKLEKDHYKKHERFFTKWFRDSRLNGGIKCAAGVSMIHISPDEIVTPCHLSLYQPNKIEYGKLDQNFEENFNKLVPYFSGIKQDKCQNCSAIYCIKCPVDKYNRDQNLLELYNGIDDKICFYYQEISKYIYYLKKKLNIW